MKKCAICGKEGALFVDHCHKTGFIRGHLCGPCNSGLGMFKDSIESMERAIKYLQAPHTGEMYPGHPRKHGPFDPVRQVRKRKPPTRSVSENAIARRNAKSEKFAGQLAEIQKRKKFCWEEA